MTKIVGLTGGIGSGKTTVALLFRDLGVPVYIADDHAKMIMQTETIINAVKKVFGEAVFVNGLLDRAKLAEVVFNDPEQLKLLNNIVHPAVKLNFDSWILDYKETPFVIYESAILFESGGFKNCDSIITVTAPIEERIKRVIKRDKTTRNLVLQRMNMQLDDEKRIAFSNFVLENTTFNEIKVKVSSIFEELSK
jgi:dephospho-CoA kinase